MDARAHLDPHPARLAMGLGLVVVLLGVLAWWTLAPWGAPATGTVQGVAPRGGEGASPHSSGSELVAGADGLANAGARRYAASSPDALGGAGLDVRVVLARDGSPLPGAPVRLQQRSELELRFACTDAGGACSFENVAAGRAFVFAAQRGARAVRMQAGERTSLTIAVPEGVDVRGLVVDSHGLPVPGATVYLACVPERAEEGDDVATADGDGRFALSAIVPGSALAARSPQHRTSPLELIQGPPGTTANVTLTLETAGAAVRGRVVDGGGLGIPDARVVVGHALGRGLLSARPTTLRGQIPPRSTWTGADGAFAVDGLERHESHPFWVGRHGYALTCVWASATSEELVIILPPEAVLAGVVESADGNPVQGANVWLESRALTPPLTRFTGPGWAEKIVQSDAAGRFELRGLPGGEGLLRGRLDAQLADQAIAIRAGVRQEARLVLGAEEPAGGPVLRGIVYDLAGSPAAHVRVTAGSPAGGEATSSTDEGGRFELRGAPGDASRLGVWDSSTLWSHPVLELEDEVLWPWVEVSLPYARPSGALTGSVEAPGAGIALELTRGSYTQRLPAPLLGGRFRLHPLPAGRYRVVAWVDGLGEARLGEVDLAPGQELDLGLVAPSGVGRIEVRLSPTVPPQPRPPDGLEVYVTAEESDLLRLASFSDGSAAIDGLPPGPYTVVVWDPRVQLSAARATVRTGETCTVTLELGNGHPVRFRFLERDEALSMLRFVWRTPGSEQPLWDMGLRPWTRPDLERFSLRLPAGAYVLEVHDTGGLASTVSFSVAEGSEGQEVSVPRDQP